MRSLITGICGFAGSHLAEHLLERGDRVLGVALPGEPRGNVAHILERIGLVELDVTDAEGVSKAVASLGPERVFHLAGLASVGGSWGRLGHTLRVNAMGLVNLAVAGSEAGFPPILAVGSAEIYGAVPEERQPITEKTPPAPTSPYALSKLWQEEAGSYLARAEGYPVHLVRPFNHTGPRQSPVFVCSDFARQMALIEAGRAEPVIRVGNLAARRDFLDVRDVAVAYRLALERGRPGVPYNVASGDPRSIGQILDMLLGLCRETVTVAVEKERFRPVDVPLLTGDAALLGAETGWAPRRPLEETLRDLLDYWRASTLESEGN